MKYIVLLHNYVKFILIISVQFLTLSLLFLRSRRNVFLFFLKLAHAFEGKGVTLKGFFGMFLFMQGVSWFEIKCGWRVLC